MATANLPRSQDFLNVKFYGLLKAEKKETLSKFVPTVFVGLGGSGKEVNMRLRKRFHDRYIDSDPRYARFVFIETNAQSFVPAQEAAEAFEPILPREDEKVDCTITETQFRTVFSNLANRVNVGHLAWLKPDMGRINPQALADGAGTHRQFGRLAFFLHYRRIRQTIEGQIKVALAFADSHPGEVESNRIEIVISGSLAGGTGSGMIIDTAYLVRDILRDPAYSRLNNKHITLIAFLPALWSDQGALYNRLQQNGYAALLELEYFGTPRTGDELFLGDKADTVSGTGFHAMWDGHDRYIDGVGWDACFLLDNVNNLSPNAPLTREEVFQMTADYLFLDFEQHKFSIEKRSARSNLVQLKDRWMGTWVRRAGQQAAAVPSMRENEDVIYATQNGCTFSTFGLAEIYFDIDKLYLAAGYRLAWQMLRARWIGENRHGDGKFLEWVKNDLGDPPIRDDQPPPPSFRPEPLARLLLSSREARWLDDLERELGAVNMNDYANGLESLTRLTRRHSDALRRGGVEGGHGAARQAIIDNLNQLQGTNRDLGPLRERLRAITAERFRALGAVTTLELIQRYHKALSDARAHARTLAERATPTAGPDPLARLKEAAMVPFPVKRVAQSIEFQRAHGELSGALRARYEATAAEAVDTLLVGLIRYVGSPNQPTDPNLANHGTLHGYYTKALALVNGVASKLEERFQYARQDDTLNPKRRLSLSVGWTPEKYDAKINEALVNNDLVRPNAQATGTFTFDWKRFEARVLGQLRKLSGASVGDVKTVDELIGRWLSNRETNEEGVARIAEQLAAACRAVLRGEDEAQDPKGFHLEDEQSGNAVDLMTHNLSQAERTAYLERLVKSSCPYLTTLGAHDVSADFAPAFSNIYGQRTGSRDRSEENATEVHRRVEQISLAAQGADAGDISSPLPAEQSSILLVREMAGFPLLYYDKLDKLQLAYERTATPTGGNDECHINYNETWRNLPDVRTIKPETYSQIRDNIQYVMLGLMTGVIDWLEGAFRIEVPDPHGIGSDPVRLGSRIHRVIKHACEEKKIRDFLRDRWTEWKDAATVAHWVALYSSGRKTWEYCQQKDINLDTGDRQSAPIRNCYAPLVDMIAGELRTSDEGKRWHALFVKAGPSARPGRDGAGDTSEGTLLVRRIEKECLRELNPDLPIYQIIEARLGIIALPETTAPVS